MDIVYHQDYNKLDDRQLVELVLTGNEEALLFLIFVRYAPLLKKLCRKFYENLFFLEQLQVELLISLKNDDFHALRSFGWRSTFGHWLGIVAGNLFQRKMPELIGISKFTLSIGEDHENEQVCLPEPEHPHEHDMNMVLLLEAIQILEDKDQRFILLKEFDGYSPKEIAAMLESVRRKENRLKTRVVDGRTEEIIPNDKYIHMLKGRTKENLKEIIRKLKSELE